MENVRPVKSEQDYEWALEEITKYFDNQPEPGTPDGDRFDVLATLIEAYEDKHYPIEDLDPIETIAAHLEMMGAKQVALAQVIGSRSRASEVMNRSRRLTMDMVYNIWNAWGIPPELLIKPYHLADPEKKKGGRKVA